MAIEASAAIATAAQRRFQGKERSLTSEVRSPIASMRRRNPTEARGVGSRASARERSRCKASSHRHHSSKHHGSRPSHSDEKKHGGASGRTTSSDTSDPLGGLNL